MSKFEFVMKSVILKPLQGQPTLILYVSRKSSWSHWKYRRSRTF